MTLVKAEIYVVEVSDMSEYLGAVIKKYREKKGKGYSQQWLANVCELSLSHVSKIEQGICDPSVKTLAKISKALDKPLWKLIKEAEQLMAKEGE